MALSVPLFERQARQQLGFLPQMLHTEGYTVPVLDLPRAAGALATQSSLLNHQGSVTELPLLDVPLVHIGTTAGGVLNAVTARGDLTADTTARDMGLQQLTVDSIIHEPPAIAALCPPEILAQCSVQPNIIPPAPLPNHQHAAREQLLQAADPHRLDTKCWPYASLVMAPLAMTEQAIEQLVLMPINAALAEGPREVAQLLADLGFPRGDSSDFPPMEPPSVVPPGGPTFEHFAAQDLRLDRTQPPTLPLPENDNPAVAPQGAILLLAAAHSGSAVYVGCRSATAGMCRSVLVEI